MKMHVTEALSSNNALEALITNMQLERLLQIQRIFFEKISLNNNRQNLLDDLCRVAEEILPNSCASIVLYDKTGLRLKVRSAPAMSADNIKAINGLVPGENSGSWGVTVYKNESQFVYDTSQDIRWSLPKLQKFAKEFNVNACWTIPIRGLDHESIGVFALSITEKRLPTLYNKKTLEICAQISALILQHEVIKAESLLPHDLIFPSEMRKAVDDKQFILHFQPQYCCKTGRLQGAEALMQWQHPRRGVISPDIFVPLAEVMGMMGEISLLIVEQACQLYLQWRAKNLTNFKLVIHLSVKQLQHNYSRELRHLLNKLDFPIEQFELEVSEIFEAEANSSVMQELNQIKQFGIPIIMTDLGSGHPFMAQIKKQKFYLANQQGGNNESFLLGKPIDTFDFTKLLSELSCSKSM